MKFIIKILLILIWSDSFSQNSHLELDLLLKKEINCLKKDEHGIAFMENSKLISNKKVIKDFEIIRKLLFLKNSNYSTTTIYEGINNILILKSKISDEKIIQIRSKIYSDSSHYEIFKYNFLIASDKNKIYIEFDENGINSYEINKRKIFVIREVVLELGENYNENEFAKEIKKVKEKYLK